MTILEHIAMLQREVGDRIAPVEDSPVLAWVDLVLRLAILRGAPTLRLLPADDGLRVVIGDHELPRVSWTGSALSRFFVLLGLEKGEEARARPQQSAGSLEVAGVPVDFVACTVPLRAWHQEIHLELRTR